MTTSSARSSRASRSAPPRRRGHHRAVQPLAPRLRLGPTTLNSRASLDIDYGDNNNRWVDALDRVLDGRRVRGRRRHGPPGGLRRLVLLLLPHALPKRRPAGARGAERARPRVLHRALPGVRLRDAHLARARRVPGKLTGLRAVRSLVLRRVVATDVDLRRVVSRCRAVERLVLDDCHRVRNVVIRGPSRKELEIHSYRPLCVALEKAPHLESAKLSLCYGVADVSRSIYNNSDGEIESKRGNIQLPATPPSPPSTASEAGRQMSKKAEDAKEVAEATTSSKAEQVKDKTKEVTKGATGEASNRSKQGKAKVEETAKEKAGEGYDAAKDKAKAHEMLRQSTDAAKDKASKAQETLRQSTDAAKDKANKAQETLRQSTDAAKDKVDKAHETLWQSTDAIAEKIGAVKDATWEKTSSAKDTMAKKAGSAKDAAWEKAKKSKEAAKGKAGEKAGVAKDAVWEKAEAAKDTACETTEAAKEKANEGYEKVKEKAREMVEAAKEKMEEVKERVTGADDDFFDDHCASRVMPDFWEKNTGAAECVQNHLSTIAFYLSSELSIKYRRFDDQDQYAAEPPLWPRVLRARWWKSALLIAYLRVRTSRL
uniref:F-box/LRR-repeat protein 15/At3g58940/PEG3-like LRR domain-containing protein n=1 Tax=Oryza punctata TaxID=4537 RepID=A0A0E0JN80_ORYPU